MKIKYSPDADILAIEFRKGKPFDSHDLAEGIILHLSRRGVTLENGFTIHNAFIDRGFKI